jgi:CheY-like chemotaxis protein
MVLENTGTSNEASTSSSYERMTTPPHCPVLIVEDDEDLREMMAHLLTLEGFEAATAANGREALEYLQTSRPEVILLDLMMPVMDGFVFLEELQRRPGLGNVPVVVLTAKQLSPEEIIVLTGRTQRIMTKQATSNVELVAAIRKCVQRHLDEGPTPRAQGQTPSGERQAG